MRLAQNNDLPAIMAIIRDTIAEMRTYRNTQWDENYPQEDDFQRDIEEGSLYIAERDGRVAGFACINGDEPAEYAALPWTGTKALVIHRMAVAMDQRQKGVAMEMMDFAEELAREQGIRVLKTDTYSLNTKMNALFQKLGYRMIGTMQFKGKEKPFPCYEKILS